MWWTGSCRRRPLPVIPGHQIVGRVDALGVGVDTLRIGQRVGVPWLGHTCGECPYCRRGAENLCDRPLFTGYTRDGGFATAALADARFAFALGESGTDAAVAPLLCAGLIGWRALRLAADATRLGLYGFGAAAHILTQVARWQGREVFAFTQPGDARTQAFARELGAVWAGDSTQAPPAPLDAAILFAPVGALVPAALAAVRKGGRVVCAGIHMSDIPSFAYRLLVGGAPAGIRRESHPRGRRGVPGAGAAGRHPHDHHHLSPATGQRGAGGSARRSLRGRRRPDS